MMKKLMVLAGLAAMLLCGCGKEETEVKTETVSAVETNIDSINELNDELIEDVTNLYIEAAKEIYGDSYDDTKAIVNSEGCTYECKFVSWEYLEEVAYNLMTNNI